jgi:hypothetical protein
MVNSKRDFGGTWDKSNFKRQTKDVKRKTKNQQGNGVCVLKPNETLIYYDDYDI